MRVCSVSDCGKVHYGHGYCDMHYRRMVRFGTLETWKAPKGAILQWIVEKALPLQSDECLILPFRTGGHGYVRMTDEYGKAELAHRYVCLVAHGPSPAGTEAAHECGNRLCVNPRHLRWATRSSNVQDSIRHGTIARGERHGQSQLTRDQVIAIRAAEGSQRSVADKYGVCQQTISNIKTGRGWSWL